MTKDEYIDKLKGCKGLDSGCNLYSELVNIGFISININFWKEIYSYYNIRVIVNSEFRNKIERSYEETAEKFNVSDRTVMRAVDYMKESLNV